MEAVFLKVFNMSIAAGWLIAAVIVLRLLLKKTPKWITCILWALVAVRLICPFSIETIFSLIPSTETVSPDIVYSGTPAIDSGVPLIDNALNPAVGESFAPKPENSVNPLQIWLAAASLVWMAGMLVLISYAVISSLRLCKKVRAAIPLRDNIWICDEIETPFIFGILKPRIYLPSGTDKAEEGYILAHEQAHLKRRDYLWKPLGFALLVVYWFHPLVWAAYILLCRDIELACDEKVIRDYGIEDKKAYSQALLSCSVSRGTVIACPLHFGEVGVKERVKSVLHYKKPGFWIILAAVLVCIVMAVCFLTDPKTSEEGEAASQISVYGVVRELELEPGHLVLEIPYEGTVEIPEAKEIYPYYEPGEEGFEGLAAGQLVKIVFPLNTDVTLLETYPARYAVEAEEIIAMSSGGFYLRQDGENCMLGFPRGWLTGAVDIQARDTLNIYRHTESADEKSQEGKGQLLASATIFSVDEEADVPMIYITLSAENVRRFLEEWSSSLGMSLEYEPEGSINQASVPSEEVIQCVLEQWKQLYEDYYEYQGYSATLYGCTESNGVAEEMFLMDITYLPKWKEAAEPEHFIMDMKASYPAEKPEDVTLWLDNSGGMMLDLVPFLETGPENNAESSVSEAGTDDGVAADGAGHTDGQFHGYIVEFGDGYVSVDEQLWITPEDEEWRSEYDAAAGFEVVDAGPENTKYLLDEKCVYGILENHWQPRTELTGEAFGEYVKENADYPVLWIFTVSDGKVIGIEEQYRP